MPKKTDKKSGDKQDEGGKAKKKESPASPRNKTVSNDGEKELYLIQIRHLSEQLERSQLKCGELERQRRDLISQQSFMEKEKKDAIQYLKRSLLAKEDEVDELSERLEGLCQAADRDRDTLQQQLRLQREQLQLHSKGLLEENRALESRLASLEEFQQQKEQLMSRVESLEEQLARQEDEHKAANHILEMEALMERKRLQEEMENRMAATAAEIQHLVDQKVPETARLALQENMEVKVRYSLLSEEAQVLMEENVTLRDKKSKLKVDVDLLEQMFSHVSRQSCIRKKAAEQLTAKCEELQGELSGCRQELEMLRTKHAGALKELEALREDHASVAEQARKSRAATSRLEAEVQEERRSGSRMKSIMQEVVVTFRQALMDTTSEQDSEVLQWKQAMQKVLLVLDGPPLPPSAPTEAEPQWDKAAAERAGGLTRTASLRFQLACYRPGDLGLVPRASPKRVGSGGLPCQLRKPTKPKSNSFATLDS